MANSDGAAKPNHPPRPTIISLPPLSYYETLFHPGGASPGPMTLVSSFFSEDPDTDTPSFSQLLAGAMTSPAAASSRALFSFPVAEEVGSLSENKDSIDGAGGRFRQNRPLSLLVAPSPYFMVPPGLSPASLLESPVTFFSPNPRHFGISHQQALAQVTAQAHSHGQFQADYPSSFSGATVPSLTQPTSSGGNMALLQQMQTSDTNNTTHESPDHSHCDQRCQPTALIVDKPADDGYNWRKYGQKQVKGSEYPRSYYKCTHPSCPVKKKVERSLDGHVTEIIYKGQHIHQQPAPRHGKEGGTLTSGSDGIKRTSDFPTNSEPGSKGILGIPIHKRERESALGTSDQLSGSSDGEEVGDAEFGADEEAETVADPKRRNIDNRIRESPSSHKAVSESRIIVQTMSEVDLLDDGYKWRKYGQKVVKGNPNPRSYYKCTYVGCNVRKHVERASTDPKAVITAYEGKHDHDLPAARKSSHSTAIQPIAHNTNPNPNNQPLLERKDPRNNTQQPHSLWLKEEQT